MAFSLFELGVAILAEPYGVKLAELQHNDNGALKNANISFLNQELNPPAGSCGENMTWSLDEEKGVLTISGTGEMLSHPWSAYSESIKSIVVSVGVTTICNSAFSGLKELTDVNLPKTLKIIGKSAFTNCDSLMFFAVPEGVSTVGDNAFSTSDSLQYLYLPSTLTSITGFDLLGALKYIFVDENNPAYTSRNGVLYTKDLSTLVCCPAARFAEKYVIPEGVTRIESGAFFWCGLKSVYIPSSTTFIGDRAFEACNRLSSVYYADSEKAWMEIKGAGKPSAGDITIYYNVNEISTENMCGDNLTWTFSESGVLRISGTGKMYNYIYSSLPWNAISDLITEIVIENGVENIGNYAFCRCTNVASVTIPEGLKSIGTYAFYGCSTLAAISLPDSLESIGDRAFYACTALEAIRIPKTVTSIGTYNFGCCSSLKRIDVSEENTVFSSLAGVMYNKEKTELLCCPSGFEGIFTVPNEVTTIDGSAFFYCHKLSSVIISAGVTSIGTWAFEDCPFLTSIVVSDANTEFKSLNGVLYSKNMKTLVCCPAGYSGDYTIPNGVLTIGNNAFYKCASLNAITIPNSVISIGNYAFDNCSALTSIAIPDSVTSIGDSAFYGCEAVLSIKIPEGVTEIGSRAFFHCYALRSVTIPRSVTVIDSWAFESCNFMKDIYYAGSQNEWMSIEGNGKPADDDIIVHFNGTYDSLSCGEELIAELYLSGKMTVSGSGAITGISSEDNSWKEVKTLMIEEGATSIVEGAFKNCTSLTGAVLPRSIESIGEGAFGENVKNIYFAGSEAEWNAISGSETLTNVTVHFDGKSAIGEFGAVDDKLECEIYCEEGSASIAFIPVYDENGRFLRIEIVELEAGEINTFSLDSAGSIEKASLIVADDSFTPVCNAKAYSAA